jgi:hypothetical protein
VKGDIKYRENHYYHIGGQEAEKGQEPGQPELRGQPAIVHHYSSEVITLLPSTPQMSFLTSTGLLNLFDFSPSYCRNEVGFKLFHAQWELGLNKDCPGHGLFQI